VVFKATVVLVPMVAERLPAEKAFPMTVEGKVATGVGIGVIPPVVETGIAAGATTVVSSLWRTEGAKGKQSTTRPARSNDDALTEERLHRALIFAATEGQTNDGSSSEWPEYSPQQHVGENMT
jgi:hypothetical protein